MRHDNEHFENADIAIDGDEFYNCHFRGCSLTYLGGTTHVEGCSFSGSNRLTFEESAANTLRFLAILYHLGFDKYIEGIFDNIRGTIPAPMVERGIH
jgi:hypothetical protein